MVNANRKSLLKSQAQKRNGVYNPGFLFWGRPTLEINTNQSRILIYFDNKKHPPATYFECPVALKNDCDSS